jgi:GNAT superfamily N-acetyltransferase
VPGDIDAVLAFVHELAAYEHEPDAVRMSPSDLSEALFSAAPVAFCHVATGRGGSESDPADSTDDNTGDGEVVGFALWYVTFSTWTGRPGIHLEDLFVRPAHRRAGHGRALLAGLAALCAERGYTRLEWSVLDWNTSAQAFYRTLGAAPTAGWDRWRLDGDGLAGLARSAG